MIHLRLRTEYSFRNAFGRLEKVLEAAEGSAVGIADGGTFGHVSWVKACKKSERKHILGVEVLVVPNAREKVKHGGPKMALLARNDSGLREIYQLFTLASNELFYYTARLDYIDINAVSDNVLILSGANARLDLLAKRDNVWLELNPENRAWNRHAAIQKGWQKTVSCANNFVVASDRAAYEILAWRNARERTGPQHILNEYEMRLALPDATDAMFDETHNIARLIEDVHLPEAQMVKYDRERTLKAQCLIGAKHRKMKLSKAYLERLDYELKIIIDKGFEDYFYVIGDMVRRAKRTMLVGPARGSAAGSLVCYLLEITDVDPIVHDLMFERFVDVTRHDLPDIDIDFPDVKREAVIEQLRERYGHDRVGRLGTVSRYKAKSALDDVSKELKIPAWEIKDVKESIIERSGGDARAQFCVLDAFQTLEVGKALLLKYPRLAIAADLEGHARQSGTHAAAVLVTETPITDYGAIGRDGSSQIDKGDAKALNLLKIDVLGLRTLSVLEDCLAQIGKSNEWLITYPLDDNEAFEIFNEERFAGIFQFEGYALKSLTRQMGIKNFDDIVAITALARPGPLHCGAAGEFIDRRLGKSPARALHPMMEHLTKESYGVVVYQEQVMATGRLIGQMSWKEVTALRKAMSASLGDEYFQQYWDSFRTGALAQGVSERDADIIWQKICTFGSWAFNKSHAVSYGLISYWCALLKAHHPLEFGAACLRNAKDNDQIIQLLRELVNEGFKYTPVDPKHSGLTWKVADGRLIGGLTNIKGVGDKKAADMIARREANQPWTPGQAKLLINPVTPFDNIFEAKERFGHIYVDPVSHGVTSGKVWKIQDIQDPGEYVVLGKLVVKNLRDLNEYDKLQARGGKIIKVRNLFLNMTIEDDTGSIIASINRYDYATWGKPIVENAAIGDWFLWKGFLQGEWRVLKVKKWRSLEPEKQNGEAKAQ